MNALAEITKQQERDIRKNRRKPQDISHPVAMIPGVSFYPDI